MDFIHILDMVMARYDMKYFNSLPLRYGNKLILVALEEQEKEKAWDAWLMKYQLMNKDTFVPFSEFVQKSKPEPPRVQHTKEELLELDAKLKRKAGLL